MSSGIGPALARLIVRADRAIELLEQALQGDSAPPQWLPMVKRGARCPVSGWSTATVQRLIAAGHLRSRKVNGSRFYSGADMRRYIATQQSTPEQP